MAKLEYVSWTILHVFRRFRTTDKWKVSPGKLYIGLVILYKNYQESLSLTVFASIAKKHFTWNYSPFSENGKYILDLVEKNTYSTLDIITTHICLSIAINNYYSQNCIIISNKFFDRIILNICEFKCSLTTKIDLSRASLKEIFLNLMFVSVRTRPVNIFLILVESGFQSKKRITFLLPIIIISN